MSVIDRLRYDGKRALVVGGATGMGAAAAKSAAELGAEVVVMDYAPVTYDFAQVRSAMFQVLSRRIARRRGAAPPGAAASP